MVISRKNSIGDELEDIDKVKQIVSNLVKKYPNFGGVLIGNILIQW